MESYDFLNKAFKTTSKLIFGEELGELKEYEDYLSSFMHPFSIKNSLSGKRVYLNSDNYSDNARYISYDNIDFMKRFEPLNINEIKDIDSIVEALKERFIYTGNVILGKSQYVEKSSDIVDSYFIYNSIDLASSRYMAFSSRLRMCEYCFGVDWGGESKFLIRNTDVYKNTRNFEAHACYGSSDTYFSWAVRNSSNVLLSFGMINESFVIGNLKLSKDKYENIKSSILDQIKEELIKNKSFPSLYELMSAEGLDLTGLDPSEVNTKKLGDCEEVEKEIKELFKTTTKAVFGKELEDITSYENYLLKRVMTIKELPSVFSGEPLLSATGSSYWNIPKNRIVSYDEMIYLKDVLSIKQEELNRSLEDLLRAVKRIFVFSNDMRIGKLVDLCDSFILSGDTYLTYKVCGTSSSKRSAYSFWPRNSEYIFGSHTIFRSQHTINTYFSADLSRSFEVSSSYNSSDIYFSHNVENIREGMFNFNVKNMSYAIGNAKYEAETYRRIKQSLIEQVVNELEEKKDFKYDIYNIGAF